MTKVQITLNGFSTPQEADEALIKALTDESEGRSHKEQFSDPAAADVFKKISIKHSKMFDKMLKDVIKVIEKDV